MKNVIRDTDWLAVAVYPLTVVLMEAFWVFPWLLWLGLWPMFAEHRPALSLPAVIIVLIVSLVLTRVSIRRQDWPLWLIRTVVIGGGFAAMFLVLRFDHGGGYAFGDAGWFGYIGGLLRNILDSPHPVVFALPVLPYLWWRGMQLGRTTSYFNSIYRSFIIGMVALILLLVFWQVSAGDGRYEGPIASIGLYILAFFFFGLVAMAVWHLYVMRKRMPAGEATLQAVWRWLPIMLGVIGGIVLVSFVIASVFQPEFFDPIVSGVKTAWSAVWTGIEYILMPLNYVFEGIMWLLRWIVGMLRQEPPDSEGQTPGGSPFEGMEYESVTMPPLVTTVLQWLVILIIVAVIVFILAKALSRFRAARDGEDIEEIHESLWSVNNLRDDLRQLFDMVGDRFRRTPGPVRLRYDDDSPENLDIREIYKRLEWEAAQSGVARRSHETPCEYEGRLAQYAPDGREQLSRITNLYSDVRYGEISPPGPVMKNANGLWRTLRGILRALRGGESESPEQ